MGKALYRKYRSKSLDEIVGQEHITATLSQALKDNKISHAYLLTGPRGVGKTSVARILAHAVNDLPYSEEAHLDIIEIDAASNRRIDEVRDLREHIYAAPASARYKVFIIDEVHMLTKEAFNALLKTLEEPPEHVIFILATTETHKVPETIISRTQRYSFRPAPVEAVVKHLQSIAKTEDIAIDKEALLTIAEHGEGSFRDSISLLDQAAAAGEHVTLERLEAILGRAPKRAVHDILSAIETGDVQKLLEQLAKLHQSGHDATTVALQLAAHIRSAIARGDYDENNLPHALKLLRELLAVPGAYHPKHTLEATLLSAIFIPVQHLDTPNKQTAVPARGPQSLQSGKVQHAAEALSPSAPDKTKKPARQEKNAETKPVSKSELKEPTEKPDPTPPAPVATVQTATQESPSDAKDIWDVVLNDIKRTHNTLYGIARMAKPSLVGDALHLRLRFKFHLKQLNTAKNTEILQAAASAVRGSSTKLVYELEEGDGSESAAAQSDISTISNIFGSAELL